MRPQSLYVYVRVVYLCVRVFSLYAYLVSKEGRPAEVDEGQCVYGGEVLRWVMNSSKVRLRVRVACAQLQLPQLPELPDTGKLDSSGGPLSLTRLHLANPGEQPVLYFPLGEE